MTDETWGRVCDELLKSVGKNNYSTWIAPLRLIEMSEGIAAFEAPTKFMRDWVSRNFAEPILRELRAAGVAAERIDIRVPALRAIPAAEVAKPVVAPAPARARVARPVDGVELPGAPLDARFTFDSFVVGKPNELAHAAARCFFMVAWASVRPT